MRKVNFLAAIVLAAAIFTACSSSAEEDQIIVQKTIGLEPGTYTIYHMKQQAYSHENYDLVKTDENVVITKNTKAADVMQSYTGYEEARITLSAETEQKEAYFYYDLKTITYTFNSGKEGKYADGSKVSKVTGKYGEFFINPYRPVSSTHGFKKWCTSKDEAVPMQFGLTDMNFTAVWEAKSKYPEGMVLLGSDTVILAVGNTDGPFYCASLFTPVEVNAFYMSKTEITKEKWVTVQDWSKVSSGDRQAYNYSVTIEATEENKLEPVTNITWNDAIVWCNAASEKEGLEPVYYSDSNYFFVLRDAETMNRIFTSKPDANGYRLPTEAEWEYAARGGDPLSSAWFTSYGAGNDVEEYCVYTENSGSKPNPVGSKTANAAGLYDMSGNVWEWCIDTWFENDSSTPSAYCTVVRGGGWDDSEDYCTTSVRYCLSPSKKMNVIGFRVCRNSK